MDAVLLAGGYGTRLRPLTYTRPKPLLPVAGRPMLEWALDRLPDAVDRVVVAVNWLADELEAYLAESERDLEFVVVREDEPLGTGGAVKNCEDHLESERFFVLNADIVSSMDLQALLDTHAEASAVATIALKEVPPEEVVHYGVAALDEDDARRIRDFVEKPATAAEAPSHLINAGAYVLDREVLDLIEPDKLVSLEKEVFPQLLPKGLYGSAFDGLWVDVGDPERLLLASRQVDKDKKWGRGGEVAGDAAFLESVAGDRLQVGAESRVERCVLGDDVTVEPESFLLDCVVGDGETVGGALCGQRVWTRPVPDGYPRRQVGNAMARA